MHALFLCNTMICMHTNTGLINTEESVEHRLQEFKVAQKFKATTQQLLAILGIEELVRTQ